MKEAFELPTNFVYQFKQDYDEYKHEGINLFLEKMYKLALDGDYMMFKEPLQAFNTAYYIATALAITPHVNLRNMSDEVSAALEKHIGIHDDPFPAVLGNHSNGVRIPPGNNLLVRWMVYAILFLQEEKSEAMEDYLEGYLARLGNMVEKFVRNCPTAEEVVEFNSKLSDMIDSCQERYHTDLYPDLKVSNLEFEDWDYGIGEYYEKDVLCLMPFFRTKEEQHRFLDWIDEMCL